MSQATTVAQLLLSTINLPSLTYVESWELR